MRTVYYILAINIITLAVYGLDKYLARTNRYRISEKNLLTLALAGGTIGAYIGQKLFRHKTMKASFQNRFWMIVALHFAFAVYLYITHH